MEILTRKAILLGGALLHDPCTIAWLLKPELFTSQHCWVGIETTGEHTQEMTVMNRYRLTENAHNTDVVLGVDRRGFVDLLVERLAFYSDSI